MAPRATYDIFHAKVLYLFFFFGNVNDLLTFISYNIIVKKRKI